MTLLLIVCSAAISTWLLCIFFSRPSFSLFVLDNPTYRSLHDVPKPRIGGLAIFIVVLVSWVALALVRGAEDYIYSVIVGICLLAIISYIDDRYSISHVWRLLVHFMAAILLVYGGLELPVYDLFTNANVEFVLKLITILLIVWMINLYNFMDGMDGLAGGMGVAGFGCLGVLGLLANDNLYALMAFIIAASSLGFLAHNFPPAKIFMGDVGSITMGYLVAFFSIWGVSSDIFAWWTPMIIFSPFIVDSTITLIFRLFSGGKFWEAHKSHNYQKLVVVGWGHRKTAIYSYALMIAVGVSTTIVHIYDNQRLNYIFLSTWIFIYVLILFTINNIFIRSNRKN